MGRNSAIGWCKHTQNFWVGCYKVSAGCKNCYMYREQNRYGNDPSELRRVKTPTFNAPLKWNTKDPGVIFVSSYTDFFLSEVPKQWRDDAWDVMRRASNNHYLILTKRPENIADMLPDDWGFGWDNVGLGVSAEDQPTANIRTQLLLNVQAKMYFLSCEPLLGFINLEDCGAVTPLPSSGSVRAKDFGSWARGHHNYIDWVIVGGESGSSAAARPMYPGWASDLLHQCKRYEIPYFFKQWGQWVPKNVMIRDGASRPLWPDGRFGDVNWEPGPDMNGSWIMRPRKRSEADDSFLGRKYQEFPKGFEVT